MIKFVECRVIDEHPGQSQPSRPASQVATVARRGKSQSAGIPKFVADLYNKLDPGATELNAVA